MSDETQGTKPSDPDNVFAGYGQAKPDQFYVFVPHNYRDAHKVLKEQGAKFRGSKWQIDEGAFRVAEQEIREAARRDIALGAKGRKEREERLAAEMEERRKAAAPTPEEKAAKAKERAKKGRDDALKRDALRVVSVVGALKVGDKVSIQGEEVEITRMGGKSWVPDEAALDDLKKRFPGFNAKLGDEVIYAYSDAPEAEKTAEVAPVQSAAAAEPEAAAPNDEPFFDGEGYFRDEDPDFDPRSFDPFEGEDMMDEEVTPREERNDNDLGF